MKAIAFAYYKTVEIFDKITNAIKGKNTSNGLVANRMGYDKISESNWKPNSTNNDYVRLRTLELIAEEINKKEICCAVAELGVFRGYFSSEINRLFPNSTLYLFDTFEGFNDIDIDYERKNGYSTDISLTDSFKGTSVKLVLSNMTYKEKCIIRKGYFPETADGVEDKFMFVSLDCDLYLPILSGLEYFYPRLVSGGYMMIHDYNVGSDYYTGVKKAVDDFETKHSNLIKLPIPDSGGTLIIVKP